MATQSESKENLSAQSDHYFTKAVELHAAGRLEDAISSYRAALHGNPDGEEILSNLGLALCQIGRNDEGIAQMRHALRLVPDDPDVLNNLGNALIHVGRLPEAIETLTHAATISPRDADVRLLLSRACLLAGKFDESVAHFKTAAMLDPKNADLAKMRAELVAYRTETTGKPPTKSLNGQLLAAKNGHAAPELDTTHEVEAPHYDARNGGSAHGGVAEPETAEPVTPADGEDGDHHGHASLVPLHADTEALAQPAATEPFSELLFHHPHSVKEIYGGSNKIFKWCIIVVVILHLAVLLYLYLTGQLNNMLPKEIRIHIVKEEKEVVKPIKAPPLGQQTNKPSHNAHQPHPHPTHAPTRSVVRSVANAPGEVADPDKAAAMTDFTNDDKITSKDIPTEDSGDQTPGNGIPAGFVNGKIGGKVYFIRLKHGSGAWDAYADGTKALLAFANKYFPCEAETRPMTAAEIRDNYIDKGAMPSFLYIYVDDTFNLSPEEVNVLRLYIAGGGFLFLDGRPSEDVKAAVDTQMERVVPGAPLTAIAGRDSINSFLFRLSGPGIGENFIGVNGVKANYAIRQNGRIVVFYTMGNFSHFFEGAAPSDAEYALAQYQMGCNVIAYAIEKGDTSKMTPMNGANAKVTTQALQALGFLEGGNKPAKPTTPGSEKILPKGVAPDQDPGEVKIDDNN